MAQSQRLSLFIWGIFSAALVAAGFACDGTTEIGHHFFLICGGIAIGYGVSKNGTPCKLPRASRAVTNI